MHEAEFYQKKGYGKFLEEKDIKNKLYDLIVSTFKDKSMLNSILLNSPILHTNNKLFKSNRPL